MDILNDPVSNKITGSNTAVKDDGGNTPEDDRTTIRQRVQQRFHEFKLKFVDQRTTATMLENPSRGNLPEDYIQEVKLCKPQNFDAARRKSALNGYSFCNKNCGAALSEEELSLDSASTRKLQEEHDKSCPKNLVFLEDIQKMKEAKSMSDDDGISKTPVHYDEVFCRERNSKIRFQFGNGFHKTSKNQEKDSCYLLKPGTVVEPKSRKLFK